MNSDPIAMVNNSSDVAAPVSNVIHLKELDICAGQLNDIIEPDGEDVALAMIESMAVEVPLDFAQFAGGVVGKRIWLAMIMGQIRAGVQT